MADGASAEPGPHGLASGDGRTADHDERHDLAIAAWLDSGLPDAERAAAERLAATCPACAVLHADLLALAAATRRLPAPARPRDFRLTAGDAMRLASAQAAGGEPREAATRLTGEMQVPIDDHRAHDPLLVASLLDRSMDGTERERAGALIASCDDCATLHRDLVDLLTAARALPTPRRMRDYAISMEDARRLRRTGWRRLVAAFGSTRDAFSRPLAIGLTTIGLAGLLVTTVPGVLPGLTSTTSLPTIGQSVGDAGAGANSESLGGAKEAPASAAASAPAPAAAALPAPSQSPTTAAAPVQPGTEPAPSAESFDTFLAGPAASPGAAAIAPAPAASADREGAERTAAMSIGQESSAEHVAVVALASLLLAAGIGLFLLRWAGRRV